MLIFVGTYTAEMGGAGLGIHSFVLDGSRLSPAAVCRTPSPSYLISDGRFVYAANEGPSGAVSSFAIPDLEPRGPAQPTGGAMPCHLLRQGRYLIAANYEGGSASVHPVDPAGRLGPRTDLVALPAVPGGGGPSARQAAPHAHQIVAASSHGLVGVVDLGGDAVHGYRLEDGRLAAAGPVLRTAPGAGPRHAVRHPSGRWYVVNELAATVSVYAPGEVASVPSSMDGGENLPAAIALSPDGGRLYVSNRGPDTITTFALGPDGVPVPLAETPTGGAWPRDLALVDGLLLVANQHSHTVVSMRLDPDTGVPTPTGDTAEIGSPTCVTPSVDPLWLIMNLGS